MKRLGMVLMLVALVPLLTGGGPAPGIPSNQRLSGPGISFTFVTDTTGPLTKGLSTIRFTRGANSAAAVFVSTQIQSWTRGCRADLADERFVNHQLDEFVPDPPLTDLLNAVGANGGGTAIIADVESATCTDDRYLGLTGLVQFLTPAPH